MMGSIYLLATVILYSVTRMTQSQTTVTFCDGNKLRSLNGADCSAGIKFGSRTPDCVCISGVHRSWTSDCEVYDGFLGEFCAPLNGVNWKTVGIELIGGVSDVYKDTAAIFSYDDASKHDWQSYLVGSEGKTKSDSFYSLNGFPVLLSKGGTKFICVEREPRVHQQVCRFFSTENKAVWKPNEEITIKVMKSCDPTTNTYMNGYTVSQFKENRCYDIMGRNQSECKLSCTLGSGGPSPSPPPSPGPGPQRPTTTSRPTGNPDASPPSPPSSPAGGDSGEESMTSLAQGGVNNANFFLHRKLNKYIRMRQVGLVPQPDLGLVAPNRTFSLLDIAKRVVRGACPTVFVTDMFIDQALELFVVLHKGQDYRFIEDIRMRDFKWIQEILLTCRTSRIEKPLKVQGNRYLPGCTSDGLIDRVCAIADGDTLVCSSTTGGKHHEAGKYHYIIDAVWNIIDMTHALCYPYFQKSYRSFHVWEQASEKLFTRDIKNLWHKPNVDLRVYDALLSPKSMIDMINLERCTEAAYGTISLPRLVRPSKPRSHFRRKRDADNNPSTIAKNLDVYCAKKADEFVVNC